MTCAAVSDVCSADAPRVASTHAAFFGRNRCFEKFRHDSLFGGPRSSLPLAVPDIG